MSTNQNTSALTFERSIEEVLNDYRGTLLNEAQAAMALPRLRTLVRATEPTSPSQATTRFASAARFLADIAPAESCDVDSLLTEFNVSRWSYQWCADGKDSGTLANHLGRLNSLLRAKAGLPPVRNTPTTSVSDKGVYDADLLRKSFDLLAATDPRAAAVLVAGAGAGLVIPDAVGATVILDGRQAFLVTSDGAKNRVHTSWVDSARTIAGSVVDADAWQRCRDSAARELDGALDRWQLRRTWLLACFTDARPVADVLGETGVQRNALDDIRGHLPTAQTDERKAWLRGDCTGGGDAHHSQFLSHGEEENDGYPTFES